MESPTENSREEAATIFMTMLEARAYQGVKQDVIKLLERGPAGGKSSATAVRLHRWYQNLDAEDQENMKALIGHTTYSSVFGCCALLDGVTGEYPVKDCLSEFVLYLKIYEDEAVQRTDIATESIRISPGVRFEEDLHDLLSEHIEGFGFI